MVKELQFDKKELIKAERPFETVHINKEIEGLNTDPGTPLSPIMRTTVEPVHDRNGQVLLLTLALTPCPC